MTVRAAGLFMIVAAVATNLLFLGLGAVFDYPEVLRREPPRSSARSVPTRAP
ncbi:hypothetical protein ACFQY4_33870 [Catellatospora bangladeshensis]|uniref:hypothetical protein n=1 Tax=Catellatospora bangladeshensis TaxID=310355 RepID=UPI0036176B7A